MFLYLLRVRNKWILQHLEIQHPTYLQRFSVCLSSMHIILLISSVTLSNTYTQKRTHAHLPWGCLIHTVRPDKWKCPGRGMSWCLDLPPGMGILLQTALSPEKWSHWYTHHSLKNVHSLSIPPSIWASTYKNFQDHMQRRCCFSLLKGYHWKEFQIKGLKCSPVPAALYRVELQEHPFLFMSIKHTRLYISQYFLNNSFWEILWKLTLFYKNS